MLTDRIHISPPDQASLSAEDILSTSLGVIFPDDINNQHGDASTPVIYSSPTYKDIKLTFGDPKGEDNRRLFSHHLWNAGVLMATLIEDHSKLEQEESGLDITDETSRNVEARQRETTATFDVRGQTILELGAGTGLAGIIAVKAGAEKVFITDYPAEEVIANISANVQRNLTPIEKGRCTVVGHEWGVLPDELAPSALPPAGSISLILAADTLWLPFTHVAQHRSISHFLSPAGRAIVIAGFHSGRAKMAGFFNRESLAEAGLEVEAIWEREAEGRTREWVTDRGFEDITGSKRWLVIGLLKRSERGAARSGIES